MSKKKQTLVTLVDLPGIKRKKVRAAVVRSVTAATEVLRTGRPIMAAGDCGALNIHQDDEGMWRCEFMRHRATVEARAFKYLASAVEWLKEWLPKMEVPA